MALSNIATESIQFDAFYFLHVAACACGVCTFTYVRVHMCMLVCMCVYGGPRPSFPPYSLRRDLWIEPEPCHFSLPSRFALGSSLSVRITGELLCPSGIYRNAVDTDSGPPRQDASLVPKLAVSQVYRKKKLLKFHSISLFP